MPYTLSSKDVPVCGEILTVSQASNVMDVERSILVEHAETEYNGSGEEGTKGTYLRYIETLLYPSLVACTTGNLPSLEQFMHSVPTQDSDRWIEVARELNPRWFLFLSSAEETSDEKKD